MTDARRRRRRSTAVLVFALALGLAMLAGCLGIGRRGGLSPPQVEALPPDMQSRYALFANRCSRCHSLSRPLDAAITSEDHWRYYVARMRRQPASGISPVDAEVIVDFLVHYTKNKEQILEGE